MVYGYARCSTNEDLQDITRQVRELKQQGATDETIYMEYESGTKINRAELAKLLNVVKEGDTIYATDCSKELDPMTEGMLKLMGVFAELERNMISQRVKSGMEHAKAKGKIVGRPATTENNIPHIFYKHYPKYKKGEINKKELSRLCSLSYPTIYKYLNIVER